MALTKIDNDQLKDLTLKDGKIAANADIQQSKVLNLVTDLASINATLAAKLDSAGDTMTGALVLSGDPINPLEAATKQYVDNTTVALDGSRVLTGLLDLGGFIPGAAHAISKSYADSNYLSLGGGTLTGFLTLNADPLDPLEAATKQYVDTAISNVQNGVLNSVPGVILGGLAIAEIADSLQLTTTPGIGTSFTNLTLTNFPSTTLDLSTTGAGGLDTGTVNTTDIYYLHIIIDNTLTLFDIIASTSAETPTLPLGYDDFIPLNIAIKCYTVGLNTYILPFDLISKGGKTHLSYRGKIDFSDTSGVTSNVSPMCIDITTGPTVGFSTIDAINFVPGIDQVALVTLIYSNADPGDTVVIRSVGQPNSEITFPTNGTNNQILIDNLPVKLSNTVFEIQNNAATNGRVTTLIKGYVI